MEIEFLILADAVEATNGKLYMIGGAWDRLTLGSYPAPVQMGIAIGLLVAWDETNERHSVIISIVDEDGNPAGPTISGEVEVGRPPGSRPGSAQRSVLAINAGFPLQKPGRFEVVVSVPLGVEKRVAFEAVIGGSSTVRLQPPSA